MNESSLHFQVKASGRLDKFLQEQFSADPKLKNITRSQLKSWIEAGSVSVNEKVETKAGFLVKTGYAVSVTQPEAPTGFEHYDLKVPILFEDETLLVIDKPAGLSMHPGAGNKNKTLVNAISAHLSAWKHQSGRNIRPGVVHRLDKDTTGVVVVAKNPAAHAHLSEQFSKHTVARAYMTLAFCTPRDRRILNSTASGKIDTFLGRDPKSRLKISVQKSGGKHAVTNWKLVEATPYGRLLEVRLETGRTHQIRVHMNSIGSPVIGDKTYGDFSGLPSPLKNAADKFGRQALHAFLLEFEHPETGVRLKFESKIPKDFLDLISVFRQFRTG